MSTTARRSVPPILTTPHVRLDSVNALEALPLDTAQNFLLEFEEPALEAVYQNDAANRTRNWHRILWSVSTFLWAALVFIDQYGAGGQDNLRVTRVLRIALAIPAAVACVALGWAPRPFFARWRVIASVAAFSVHMATFVLIGALLPHPELVVAAGNAMGVGVLLFGLCIWCALLRLPQKAWVPPIAALCVALSFVNNRFPMFAANDVRFWFFVSILVGIFVARELERANREAFLVNTQLAEERGRSEQLLRAMLPRPIVERLKRSRGRIADRVEAVSVLFADLVGFTVIASRMPAERVVAKLDDIFSYFDEIAQRLGLEKIKTIGDAYMLVSGIPTARSDHARATVQMAIEMLRYMVTVEIDGQKIGMRIGVHSGTVIAGVIGKQKPSFDVWGDTVNIASRMESHGIAGFVQITAATKALLGEGFTIEPRGSIEVKGVGQVETWLVRP